MRAVIDADMVKFRAASLAEDKHIIAVHKQTGNEYRFNNRTELWGHHSKKVGGWLSKQNVGRLSPMLPEDFDVQDFQTPKPLSEAKLIVDTQIGSFMQRLGTDDYYGYVGRGDSFRVEYSTILKYKSNRTGKSRPVHLDAVAEYLVKKHNCSYQEHLECDDRVVIDWYAKEADVVIMQEKDGYGTGVLLFNPDAMDFPLDTSGIGRLYMNGKREIKGYGRIWKYFQALSGDDSDFYWANCASDMKWGEKAAFQLLDPCHTDKECFEALVAGYKKLYPEPKKILGWRGDEIEIDWLYVLNENLNLAHIHRRENDFINTKEVIDKLGITY